MAAHIIKIIIYVYNIQKLLIQRKGSRGGQMKVGRLDISLEGYSTGINSLF